jgi:2-polyprenyl-3-methyl-5-hydroxy-6-metoxy-1,4-benzoquinol methylase
MRQEPTVNAYFDSQATFWKDLYARSGVYAVIHQERQAVVLRWIDELGLAPGACILDIGCGAGFVSIALAQRGFSVHAIDSAEAMVEQASRNATEAGLADRISVAVGDVYRLDEPDDAFDLVLAIGVLPWLDQPRRAIREMARVTRPGGNVILTADNWSRLDHLLDPWLNPLVVPLKRHAKALLERFGRRRRTIDDVGARDLRRSVIDRELGRAGLVKVRDHGLGFGPFSYFRQHLFPEPLGTTLHHRLQRLADRGVPGLHVAAAQYIVQAQKEADCRRA